MLKRDPRVPYFMQALGQDVCEALDKFGMFRSDIFLIDTDPPGCRRESF